ncbi:MAG: metallophosphoesterase [Caulobacteraceae bacterium]|nr:metallophosphoesterase [Caulobacter sp.]
MIGEATFEIPHAVAPGNEIFAIGDIHGGADLLAALLEHARTQPRQAAQRTIVQLGDLIDRGPRTLATLDLMAEAARLAAADTAIGLMGNHEQMLVFALSGMGYRQAQIYELWIDNGGAAVLRECFGAKWRQRPAALREALGSRLDLLRGLRSHWRSGDVLFVHAGLAPDMSAETFLAKPWDEGFATPSEDEHWSWIRAPFLQAASHHGLFVCHGHSPHDGLQVPPAAAIARHRLNLDVGSTRTGMARMARFVDSRVTLYAHAGQPEA